ncbi:TIGR02391 family protein [Streptomyces sp. NPDC005349]|uniref:TIGR02391 family protein n=1 Tax=Streptomyces sp. NPDC005349 TaxID=3157037 RepID=UPI0033BF7F8F
MKHDWAAAQLRSLVADINALIEWDEAKRHVDPWGDGSIPAELANSLPDEDDLVRREVIAMRIASAYEDGLGGEYTYRTDSVRGRWVPVKEIALRALALAESAADLEAFLQPGSPALGASTMHPWVWEPTKPLWAAGAHQEAVLAAARTVNARLQQKLGRHDVSETDLVLQGFDLKDPQPGKPRLRVSGDDRSQPSWVSAQEGAKFFGVGCFRAIRNLAAHMESVTWSEQEALEYLAAFSAFARWVESASVESAD